MLGASQAPPPSSIAQNPHSTWNTNQVGPHDWGTGSTAFAGLQRAAPQQPQAAKPPRTPEQNQVSAQATNYYQNKFPGAGR